MARKKTPSPSRAAIAAGAYKPKSEASIRRTAAALKPVNEPAVAEPASPQEDPSDG